MKGKLRGDQKTNNINNKKIQIQNSNSQINWTPLWLRMTTTKLTSQDGSFPVCAGNN